METPVKLFTLLMVCLVWSWPAVVCAPDTETDSGEDGGGVTRQDMTSAEPGGLRISAGDVQITLTSDRPDRVPATTPGQDTATSDTREDLDISVTTVSGGNPNEDLDVSVSTVSGGNTGEDVSVSVTAVPGGNTREDLDLSVTTVSGGSRQVTAEQSTNTMSPTGVALPVSLPTPVANTTQSKQPATTRSSDQEQVTSMSDDPTTSQPPLTSVQPTMEDVTTAVQADHYPCGKVTFKQRFNSTCNPCYVTRTFGCPQGSQFQREWPCLGRQFCKFECELELIFPQCCLGMWGPDCQPCPGAQMSEPGDETGDDLGTVTNVTGVCSGRGECSQGLKGNGSCACDERFTGFACELCASADVYGEECNTTCECVHGDCDAGITGTGRCDCHIGYQGEFCDQLAQCDNRHCGLNGRCQGSLGQSCVCLHGYKGDGKNCTMIDMCKDKSARCDQNALCEMLGPANYTCTCKKGFEGDGFSCEPIDPCQDLDAPVCPLNSSSCVYTGPGLHTCQCLSGFANYTEGFGCAVRDLCLEKASACHSKANCTMVSPNKYTCTCIEGYVGNGKQCNGNILQKMQELNKRGQFRNRLNKAIQLFEFALPDALQSSHYLTVFVPHDLAFAGADLPTMMRDWTVGSQTVKNHVLPVARTLHQLVNGSVFYTLDGNQAEISVISRKGQIRYRLARTNQRAKVVRGNFPAANGIIHIINKLVKKPPVIGYKKRQTLYSQIQQDGRYNRLEGLLGTAGLQSLLHSNENYTIFTPNNKAWDNLGDGVLPFLQSTEGKAKLIALIKNHMVEGNYYSFSMLTRKRVKTLSNNILEVRISPYGQLLLNGNTSIVQSDIPAVNGLFHSITEVLIPESILPILNRRCDTTRRLVVPGACSVCSVPRCHLTTDELLTDEPTNTCVIHIPMRRRRQRRRGTLRVRGCRPQCQRNVTEKRCCENFFGPTCDPCPGGPLQPCGGRGECNSGIEGNGTCNCHRNFTGSVCNQCSDNKKYGPTCSQDCPCLHGQCINNVQSRGVCKLGTCEKGYFGVFCKLQEQKCGVLQHTHCHAHADCSFVNGSLPFSTLLYGTDASRLPYGHYASLHYKLLQLQTLRKCHCMDGYVGDGVEQCTPVDPCTLPTRGNCHMEAECTYVSPGIGSCKCNSGWVGDGFYCYPSTPCLSDVHCHPDAFCERAGAGEYQCICNENFHGNGTYCIPNNMCDFNNGGCSLLASCTPLGPGNRTCTCAAGYGGDGVTCIGSMWQELQMIESLQEFQLLLSNTSLPSLLSDLESQFTVFAPNDSVLLQGKETGSPCLSDNLNSLQYYIVPQRHTLAQLRVLTHVTTESMNVFLPTLAKDGGKARELKITFVNNLTINTAHIISGDNSALNGLIHIIDDCLQPRKPSANLSSLLTSLNRFSSFTSALKHTGLEDAIEGLRGYTLFILDNAHWKAKWNNTNLKKYLSYYVIPKKLSLDALPSSFLQESTLLGRGPSSLLNITTRSGKVFLNEYAIYDDRLRTNSGVVYHLSHPLDPNLNRCDISDGPGHYRRECCPGYYGYGCVPCPGGANSTCNNHGTCSSGITGTGECACYEGYIDDNCGTCDDGYLRKGSECHSDPCFFCHTHAECVHRGNTTFCRCAPSYVGDGIHCRHACTVNNGGCDPNANCTNSAQTRHRTICECPTTFYGHGRNCTRIVNVLESIKSRKDTLDFYTLVTQEGQGDGDRPGYVEDLMENSPNITLVVPLNWAINCSLNETNVDVKRHIVTEYFELVPSLFESNHTYLTLSGASLDMDYIGDEGVYRINGSLVVHRNIPATNGIVHVIDQPLQPPPITAAVTSEQTLNTMIIVIGSVAAALILIILVIILVICKCRKHCHKPDKGHSGFGFKFAILDDTDERSTEASVIDAASLYHNPLYDSLESSGLTEESTW